MKADEFQLAKSCKNCGANEFKKYPSKENYYLTDIKCTYCGGIVATERIKGYVNDDNHRLLSSPYGLPPQLRAMYEQRQEPFNWGNLLGSAFGGIGQTLFRR